MMDYDKLLMLIGNEALKRAVEIAMIQNQTIYVYGLPNDIYLSQPKDADIYIHYEKPISLPVPKELKSLLKDEKTRMTFEPYKYYTSEVLTEQKNQTLIRIDKAKKFLANNEIKKSLDDTGHAILKRATSVLNLSEQQIESILKTSISIASLDSSGKIKAQHIAEAIQYRA